MERRTFLSSILAGTATTAVSWHGTQPAASAVEVGDLRCEYIANPIGVDVTRPRLSWVLTSHRRGDTQSAYQVLVGSSADKLNADEGDLWDSGKVISGQSTQVLYQGKDLSSRQRCYWKVRIWDRQAELSHYSGIATWEMGFLSPADWKARWVGFTPG